MEPYFMSRKGLRAMLQKKKRAVRAPRIVIKKKTKKKTKQQKKAKFDTYELGYLDYQPVYVSLTFARIGLYVFPACMGTVSL